MHGFPSTNSGSQEVNYNTRGSGFVKSSNTGSGKNDKDSCHANKLGNAKSNLKTCSVKTGPASTNEKKECRANNLFNFLDSCNNSSNAKPSSKW